MSTKHSLPYDSDCLVYLNEVPSSLLCPICRAPFLDPQVTPCSHIFCASCLSRATSLSTSVENVSAAQIDAPRLGRCPVCREPLDDFALKDASTAPRIIRELCDELVVKCPLNCGRNLRRDLLPYHVKDECPNYEVPCPDTECIDTVPRHALNELETCDTSGLCLHVSKECEHCRRLVPQNNSARFRHLATCEALSHKCNHCLEEFTSAELELHRAQGCPRETLECEAAKYGCRWQSLRSDQSAHHQSCSIYSMKAHLERQESKIGELALQNVHLKHQLSTLISSESSVDDELAITPGDREYLLSSLSSLRSEFGALETSVMSLETRYSHSIMSSEARTREEMQMLRGQVAQLRGMLHHWVANNRVGPSIMRPPQHFSGSESCPAPLGHYPRNDTTANTTTASDTGSTSTNTRPYSPPTNSELRDPPKRALSDDLRQHVKL